MEIRCQRDSTLISGAGGNGAVVRGIGLKASAGQERRDVGERIVGHRAGQSCDQEGAGVDGGRFHRFTEDDVDGAVEEHRLVRGQPGGRIEVNWLYQQHVAGLHDIGGQHLLVQFARQRQVCR